jgi:hypothetical protein
MFKLKAPMGLVAKAVSSKQINLSWIPSPDSEGVTAYLIERNELEASSSRAGFAEIASEQGSSYIDKGQLFSNTTYRYRLRATDSSGSFSSYSKNVDAKTHSAPVALRKIWMDAQALVDRDPANIDLDTLCLLKAIQAAKDLSKTESWPSQCGQGWNIDSHIVIVGYDAAKTALPRYTPERGDIGGFIYDTAKHTIAELADDESRIVGTRIHSSVDARKEQIKKKPWTLRRRLLEKAQEDNTLQHIKLDDYNDIEYPAPIKTAAGLANPSEQEIVVTATGLLSTLTPEERQIMERRFGFHGPEATLAELASDAKVSISTIDRRIKKQILPKLRSAAQK